MSIILVDKKVKQTLKQIKKETGVSYGIIIATMILHIKLEEKYKDYLPNKSEE